MIDNFDEERYALLSLRCVGLRITSTSVFPSKGILSNLFGRSGNAASQAKNEKRWMTLSQSDVFALGSKPTNLKFEQIYASEVFEDIPELNLCLLARIKLQPPGFDSQVRVTVFYSSSLSSGKDVVIGIANFKEKELLRMVADSAYGVFMSDIPNEYCQGTKVLIERIPLLPQPLEDKLVPITAQKYELNPLFQNYVFYPKPDSMSPNLIVTEQSWEPKFAGIVSLMFLNNLLASLTRSCSAWQHRRHLERIRQTRFHNPQEAINYGWNVVMVTVKAARIACTPERTGGPPVPVQHNTAYQHQLPVSDDHVLHDIHNNNDANNNNNNNNRKSVTTRERNSSARGSVAMGRGMFSTAATVRKHDEYLPSTFVSILIEDTSKTFIEPVGRTNTEHFTLFPVYGSNLNGSHSRKLTNLLASTYADTVHLSHVEKEFLFQTYEAFQRVYTPHSWAWLPLSLKSDSGNLDLSNDSNATKSQSSGDKHGSQGGEGRLNSDNANFISSSNSGPKDEPVGFQAITGKVYSFTKYVSNCNHTSIKLELFAENVSATIAKKIGVASIPITSNGSFSGWLPLTMVSNGMNDMASCDAAEVLVDVNILSPTEEGNRNGTVDNMPEVMCYHRAADGTVEPAKSEDYRRSLANCYEWMWMLGLNGYDPLMLDGTNGNTNSNHNHKSNEATAATTKPSSEASANPTTATPVTPIVIDEIHSEQSYYQHHQHQAEVQTTLPTTKESTSAPHHNNVDSDEDDGEDEHEKVTSNQHDEKEQQLSYHERERIQNILHDIPREQLSQQYLQEISMLSDEAEDHDHDDDHEAKDIAVKGVDMPPPTSRDTSGRTTSQDSSNPPSRTTSLQTTTTKDKDKSSKAQIMKQYSPFARRGSQGGAGIFPSAVPIIPSEDTTTTAVDEITNDNSNNVPPVKPPKPPRRNSLRLSTAGTTKPLPRADCPYSLAWIDGHVRSLKQLIEEVETIINHIQAFVSIDRTFRSSTLKKQIERQALPTNLHYQVMGVRPHGTRSAETAKMEVIHSVSCGAMTPHMLKHKKGGLYHQEGKLITLKYEISQLKSLFAHQVRERGGVCIPTDNSRGGAYHTMLTLTERAMTFDQQSVDVCRRRMYAISQSLSIAINAFLLKLNLLCAELIPLDVAEIWLEHGFLLIFEGLLSVTGAERSMLEDTISAVEALKLYRIRIQMFEEEEEDRRREMSFDVKGREVLLFIPRRVVDKLPNSYQVRLVGNATNMSLGVVLQVYPVLFTQGIDMQQTMANTFGSDTSAAELQNLVNRTGYIDINRYAHATQRVTYDSDGMSAYNARDLPAHPLVQELSAALLSSEEHLTLKNVDLLDALERLVVVLHGVRVTFCKSGKDRTGMAVTLEQAKQLTTRYASASLSSVAAPTATGTGSNQHQKEKEHSDERLLQMANLLRVHGTRIMVAEKNIGRPVYSINLLQARFLPPLLRPPPSVCQAMLKKDNS